MSERIVVIGGGVIGTMCAYFLNRAGAAVTLIDERRVGRQCSHGNCGYVSPSHALPLAGPGAIAATLREVLRPNSAIAVKPRLDPRLWRWLLNFARRCNRRDMLASAAGIGAMLNRSRHLYDTLFAEENLQAEWRTDGILFVFETPRAFDHYAGAVETIRQTSGQTAARVSGPELAEREPALKPGLAGAYHFTGDAHLRPDRLMAALRELLVARGVEVREDCRLERLARSGDRVTAAETSQGSIPGDRFVVATGAWTPLLASELGRRLPIVPGKGYSLTMPRPDPCPDTPMILEEHHVAITPMDTGYRIGSTMQFAGYDDSTDPKRVAVLTRGASRYLRVPMAEPVQETWWGWRPMVYDGKPIIGPVPAASNVLVAAGHGMLGLSMATGTAELVRDLITGRTPSVDPAAYRADRF